MLPLDAIPQFRETLITGGYNLLFGAGVSLTSTNKTGRPLRGARQLTADLCEVVGARPGTSLQRAASLLTPEQIISQLVEPHSGCRPSDSLRLLPRYVWKRMFTLNIDDVIESTYATREAKQRLVALNFDSDFEPSADDRSEVILVHLHGDVRHSETGFVFSATEYARLMSRINPWMLMLSQIISTEPFIIAGTSLNEIDLEYYLSHRTPVTPRRGRGPSLLIEPDPDRATEKDCERYGLLLVKATFDEFLQWLASAMPNPPDISSLVVPADRDVFPSSVDKRRILRFFSDFQLVDGREESSKSPTSRFFYGSEPSWKDIAQHLDVERTDNTRLMQEVRNGLAAAQPPVIVALDAAGTGKSTLLHRVAHDLARSGTLVFSVQAFWRIDTKNAIECLASLRAKCVIIVDDLAEHVEQIREIISNHRVRETAVVLGADRDYRKQYLDLVLAELPLITIRLQQFTAGELEQIVEQYRRFGLLGAADSVSSGSQFVQRLARDPVAVAVCRILNDFRPLERIVSSLWAAATSDQRRTYLAAALARFCYVGGLRYSILQSVAGTAVDLNDMLGDSVPLRLATHPDNDEFVVPQNGTIGDRILRYAADHEHALLLDVFVATAEGLSPYVNRQAIIRRSPESRVASRLFDADQVVKRLLKSSAELFFETVKVRWSWNVKYWEQRALLTADNDLPTAIQYARHAVAIERHAFPLTTLAKLLLQSLKSDGTAASVFAEAFESLRDAIEQEFTSVRIAVQPFMTLINGAIRFFKCKGELTLQQRIDLNRYVNDARHRFRNDEGINRAIAELDRLMAAS